MCFNCDGIVILLLVSLLLTIMVIYYSKITIIIIYNYDYSFKIPKVCYSVHLALSDPQAMPNF